MTSHTFTPPPVARGLADLRVSAKPRANTSFIRPTSILHKKEIDEKSLRASSLEQLRREIVQVVPPVNPGVSAAADVQLVLDAVLFQQLGQVFGAFHQA